MPCAEAGGRSLGVESVEGLVLLDAFTQGFCQGLGFWVSSYLGAQKYYAAVATDLAAWQRYIMQEQMSTRTQNSVSELNPLLVR